MWESRRDCRSDLVKAERWQREAWPGLLSGRLELLATRLWDFTRYFTRA